MQDKEKQIDHEEEVQEIESLEEERNDPKLVEEQEDSELVAKLASQVETLQDKLLRAMAEAENIRNRMNKMIEEARDYSIVNLAKDLVPVIDNLDRALSHTPENLDETGRIIVEGVKMTQNELESVFKKHGIVAIEPQEGENFDYNNHYAIEQIASEGHKEGNIVRMMQKGYKIKERLIRPASVSVAK